MAANRGRTGIVTLRKGIDSMTLQDVEALAVGLAVGFLFARLRLPIPAPPTLTGILGIVGIFLGYKISGLF